MHSFLRNLFIFCFAPVAFVSEIIAQDNKNAPVLLIKRTEVPIKIDGMLDERAWLEADSTGSFHQQFPYDSSLAQVKTVVRATYDDHFIYFAAKLYTEDPEKFVVPSLRRDFFGGGIDLFAIILDSFQDKTNAFTFGTNPAGVQREGLVSSGGVGGNDGPPVDFTWDNKWYNEVGGTQNAWIYEIAIPFKSVRYKAGATQWNINFYRQDTQGNERSLWARVPRIFPAFALNYCGVLQFDAPLKKAGPNISLIPYLAAKTSRNYVEDTRESLQLTYGTDAKIAVTSALNLDITINPDFSNTDVDEQQTNLNRFELFFPERRQFFLENKDLFSDFGGERSRPFFSRRIGLALDTSTGQYIQNDIQFGARLSGNLNKNWRIGLLSMQADDVPELNIPNYNFAVATAQRRIGAYSNIRAIFVNREDLGNSSDYNRVAGLDYNYNLRNNKYRGNVFFHQQFAPEFQGKDFDADAYSAGASFNYNSETWFGGTSLTSIGSNYAPVVGYTPREGFDRVGGYFGYQIYPKRESINRISLGTFGNVTWDAVWGRSDRENGGWFEIGFLNSSELNININNNYTFLFDPYDPSETDGPELAQASDYTYTQYEINYRGDQRRKLNYRVGAKTGQYYNGNLSGVNGNVGYRWQPYGIFSIDFDVNQVRLPEGFNDADILVIGPKVDLTLTKNVFWTSVIQYNSQFDNMNVYSRFQWRFKPVSDLFIVYTDNYFYDFRNTEDNFSIKNRSLVVKLTYWLNL